MNSFQIISFLKDERRKLIKVSNKAKEELGRLPEGTVQIKKYKNGYQFFHRRDTHMKNGVYIPCSEYSKAVGLVQKRYLMRMISAADKQKRVIESFLRRYRPDVLENVFINEGETRQAFLTPLVLPDERYAADWQALEYEGKQFRDDAPEHYTQKHERVRSKSEVLIANALKNANIPYRYECPMKVSNHVIYPDFTILRISDRKEIIWEHLGMMDDAEYRNNAFQRIREYEANGFFPGENLIITIETYKLPLNALTVEQMIVHYLTVSI